LLFIPVSLYVFSIFKIPRFTIRCRPKKIKQTLLLKFPTTCPNNLQTITLNSSNMVTKSNLYFRLWMLLKYYLTSLDNGSYTLFIFMWLPSSISLSFWVILSNMVLKPILSLSQMCIHPPLVNFHMLPVLAQTTETCA